MGKTGISWAEYVWNPIVGCTKVSAGCQNCWAERMALRLKHMGQADYQGVIDDEGRWTGQVNCLPHRLEQPLHWRKPRRIFVCSMSDLFHPLVPFEFIAQVFNVIASPRTEQHTFMLLTKRPDRMRHFYNWLNARFKTGGLRSRDTALGLAFETRWPLPNVWLLTTVENYENLGRLDFLLRTPAVLRGVCLEPMLERLDLQRWLPDLGWVIIGGESGLGRREFKELWAWDVLEQCRKDGIPAFLKQGSGIHPGVPLLDREGREVKEWPKI